MRSGLRAVRGKRTSMLGAINYSMVEIVDHSDRSESQLVENRDFCLSHLHLASLLGGESPIGILP